MRPPLECTKLIESAQKDPLKAKLELIRFIRALNEKVAKKEIGPTEARRRITPIKLALDLNEVSLPWRKIMRLLPAEKRSKDREYQVEEIQKLLHVSSLHLQVAILFMASSGMRVGAFDYMRVGDVEPVLSEGDKILCGKATVYAGEGVECQTLISGEALVKFHAYLETRRAKGEELNGESPLLVTRRWKVSEQRKYSVTAIRNDVTRALWKSGIRTKHEKRFDVQACHGLRKFFDNIAKDHIQEDYVEKLMGHDTGTKEHYDRRIPKPSLDQYVRAMPYLSLETSYRSEAELAEKLEKTESEPSRDFADLRLKLLEKNSEVTNLAEKVERQENALKEVSSF